MTPSEEFLAHCQRLARFIERSIDDMTPEELTVAWAARNSALCADQVAFEESGFVRMITLTDIAEFTMPAAR